MSELVCKTIGEGIEAVIRKFSNEGQGGEGQRAKTKEILTHKLVIEKPQLDFTDAFCAWTEKQTKWYFDNFVLSDAWLQLSKECVPVGRQGSSYCYFLRYHANDSGISEINNTLSAIDQLEGDQLPLKSFSELFVAIQDKVIPDVAYSVLKYIKQTSLPLFQDVCKTMQNRNYESLDLFGFSNGSSILVPKPRDVFEDQVVEQLKDKKTMRAFTSGIYNLTDVGGRVGRPPLSAFQARVKDEKIHGTVYMRGNEMMYGAPLDLMHGLRYLERISSEIDLDVGSLTLFSNCGWVSTIETLFGASDKNLETQQDVMENGIDAMKVWLGFVTSTKSASEYPEL